MDAQHLFGLAPRAVTRSLHQTVAHSALTRLRHTGKRSPVDFTRGLGAERFGQRPCHGTGPRQQQNARCVLIKPVDKPRFILEPKAQRLGQPVDMFQLLRATLRRQARRFVDRKDMVVAVKHCRLDHLRIRITHTGAGTRRGSGRVGQRRHAHLLAFFQTGVRLHAAPVDTDLALAAHLFDTALPHLREHPAKPAVKPLIGVIRADCQGLNSSHAKAPRMENTPATSASSDTPTDKAT